LYYGKAASQRHPSGMNNFGRCLEYGQGTEADPIRAAKYYRLSAELKNADGANNFGICLEKGIGVSVNIDLAAEYYRQSADDGHSDGCNNFGFCLEHGRGVKQDIALATLYYKRASDLGHPEADINYRRCLRLVGQWIVPDRSSNVSEQKPVFAEEAKNRTTCFETALEAIANTKASIDSIDEWLSGNEIGKSELSVVKLVRCIGSGEKRAMKTQLANMNAGYLERERSIHAKLNHPLIVKFEKYIPATQRQPEAILSEFVPNGSLADHLPRLKRFWNGTRTTMIVTGIVLAMRYLHSRHIIHGDLNPSNVFIDWNWIIRIGDFNYSLLADDFGLASEADIAIRTSIRPYDCRYIPPECFQTFSDLASDVFSFGLILRELLTGNPPFPPDLAPLFVSKSIVIDGFRPDVPDWIAPNARKIILACLERTPEDRPSFTEILWQLKEIKFQITNGVDSKKVAKFVEAVKQRETQIGIEIDDFE
jgi:hypothetical protein